MQQMKGAKNWPSNRVLTMSRAREKLGCLIAHKYGSFADYSEARKGENK